MAGIAVLVDYNEGFRKLFQDRVSVDVKKAIYWHPVIT